MMFLLFALATGSCNPVMTDVTIQTNVDNWIQYESLVTTLYCHISIWDVSQVTDMA